MCEKIRQDDLSIGNEARLFRRVHLSQIVRDEDTGLARVSSGAFRDVEMSIDIELILTASGLDERHCLEGHNAHRLVSLSAGGCRQLQQLVCADPDETNPAHGLVCGRKKGRTPDGLRELSLWVIPPTAPDYESIRNEKRRLGLCD